MKKFLTFLFIVVTTMGLVFSCGKDDDTPADTCGTEKSYDADIKSIVDSSCAYAGCHIDAANNSPDLSSYDLLKAFVDDDTFTARVLTDKNMPPETVPDGFPTELTQAQLDIIQCWIDDGYPE